MGAREVDDPAAASRAHDGDRLRGAPPGAEQVRLERELHPGEVRHRSTVCRPVAGDTCVVHQHIHRTEPLDGLLKRAAHRLLVGDVQSHSVLSKLNEYHGFLALPAGTPRPDVGTMLPVVPNHVCPVVNCFEELVVTDIEGAAALQRWPVAARGLLS